MRVALTGDKHPCTQKIALACQIANRIRRIAVGGLDKYQPFTGLNKRNDLFCLCLGDPGETNDASGSTDPVDQRIEIRPIRSPITGNQTNRQDQCENRQKRSHNFPVYQNQPADDKTGMFTRLFPT